MFLYFGSAQKQINSHLSENLLKIYSECDASNYNKDAISGALFGLSLSNSVYTETEFSA